MQWRSLCDHFFDDHDYHDDGDLGDDLNDHVNDNGGGDCEYYDHHQLEFCGNFSMTRAMETPL